MRKALLLLFALGLFPTLVFAQAETTGRITGTVTTEDKTPIAEAEITVTSPSLAGTRKTMTDENGRYLISLLPSGLYELRVNAKDMAPREFKLRVGVNQVVPLDVMLKPGTALEEEVNVYAPAVKMQTTAGGENFDYKSAIDLLPVTIQNRTIDGVATLAPNTSFGPTANTISISGAPSYDNSVLLDGSDISDPFYSGGVAIYLEEAIEEVQVMTNGVSARYGRFQGGVINATTKSGGNTFDGTVRADIAKESWNSKTPFPGEQQADTYDKVYSATFGGPIVKDHLWFFTGGRTIPVQANTQSTLVTPDNFTTETSEDRFQIKLTGSINANHTIEGSYLKYDRTRNDTDPFAWAAELAAVIPERTDPREFYTADYRGVLSDHTFLDATVAKKDVSIKSGGDPNGPSPILEYFGGEYRAYANGWFDPNDPSVRNSESAALSLTHNFSTANWGAHTIEYGIQYVDSITAGDNRQSPTGYNLYLNTPNEGTTDSFADCSSGTCLFDMDAAAYFNERLVAIPGAGEQDLKNYAAYLQDSWEINKFRLDVGLRYEKWKGQAISPAMNLDFTDFSPRLGVTYNISSDWQLQASWGKYASRFNDSIANGISGISSIFGPGYLQEYVGPQLLDQTAAQVDTILRNDAYWGPGILAYVNPLQPTNFFADDVSTPYANDFNLSVKRALPKNQGLIEIRYTRRSFEELLDNYVGGLGSTTITLPDNSTSTVDRLVWDNCGECQRDYESITANWEYRPNYVWDLGGNYTYAVTQGNYEGEASGQPAIGSIIGNYPNNVDPALAYPYGYVLSDVRHSLRGWGNYRIDFNRGGKLTLGGILSYRSGSAYSHTGRVDAGTDPAPDYSGAPGSYTAYFGGRGSHRFPGFWHLDTTIRYDIKFWKSLGGYVKFDIINITNEDELTTFRTGGTIAPGPGGINQFTPNSTYGTPSSEAMYQQPRSFFITAGLNW